MLGWCHRKLLTQSWPTHTPARTTKVVRSIFDFRKKNIELFEDLNPKNIFRMFRNIVSFIKPAPHFPHQRWRPPTPGPRGESPSLTPCGAQVWGTGGGTNHEGGMQRDKYFENARGERFSSAKAKAMATRRGPSARPQGEGPGELR